MYRSINEFFWKFMEIKVHKYIYDFFGNLVK